MSVLSFPRLYFNGRLSWDPTTANNNDYVASYAAADGELDWHYLESQGVTPENFRTEFRPWAMRAHADLCNTEAKPNADECAPAQHMGSRWDYYGSGGVEFVDYQEHRTLTVGGDLAFREPAPETDALLGQPMAINGNTRGGRDTPARLVDVNPGSPWSSQIYLAGLRAGNDETFIGGKPTDRMYSRSFFVPRTLADDLIIAGAIGVTFQTTIATDQIESRNEGGSTLLASLLEAAHTNGARGLMVRFSVYNTLYYQNGVFNDFPDAPNCQELSRRYLAGEVFANPAYSQVAGVLGVWNEGELSTAPQGHFLVAHSPVPNDGRRVPLGSTVETPRVKAVGYTMSVLHSEASAPPARSFGNAWVEIDTAAQTASIDLDNAVPEKSSDGEKVDFGDLCLGIELDDGFEPIGVFGYADYDKDAYDAKAGIVDVAFGQGLPPEDAHRVTPGQVEAWLAEGRVALRQVSSEVLALRERALTAETDQRGVYLDQCRTRTVSIAVRYKGGPPPAGTKIRLAEYYPWPLKVGSNSWKLAGTVPTPEPAPSDRCTELPSGPYLELPDGDTVSVVGDEATVRLRARTPGFPILVFFPYGPDDEVPIPPDEISFGLDPNKDWSIDNAMYAAVRCLPFDNALVAEFVDRWNGTGPYQGAPKYDRQEAWDFVYRRILYLHDMLYPVMDQFTPLGDLVRVEGAIDQLLTMVSTDFETSTLSMPVTRELSSGKRAILETWGNLVVRRYPQEPISLPDLPCDF